MAKQLNRYQFVEIMANLHLVTDSMSTALGMGITEAIAAFLSTKSDKELEGLHVEVLKRQRELAEVHLHTAQRQFRGARNAPDPE